MVRIDAKGLHYKKLNDMIWEAIENGETEIVLDNVCGQRYIGAGIRKKVRIEINGVPGNDLGVFMDGPEITVNGNAQDGVGNTMNSGKIVVHGHAGDIIGYAMRGGHIYIKKCRIPCGNTHEGLQGELSRNRDWGICKGFSGRIHGRRLAHSSRPGKG